MRLISAAGADKAFVHSPLHGERFRRRASESGDRARGCDEDAKRKKKKREREKTRR